jgi:hypothetical protein
MIVWLGSIDYILLIHMLELILVFYALMVHVLFDWIESVKYHLHHNHSTKWRILFLVISISHSFT